MRLDLQFRGAVTRLDLPDGPATVGGVGSDTVQVPGAAPKMLQLLIDQSKLKVLALGQSHLVLEGESLTVGAMVLTRPILKGLPRRNTDTALVAMSMLKAGAFSMAESRAATLTCLTGDDAETVYPLAFSQTVLGRGELVDIRLRDRSVSRHHATLFRRGSQYFVEPSRTTNGVFVNGTSLKGPRVLSAGDHLELGHTVLRFDDAAGPPEDRTELVTERPPPGPESGLLGVGIAVVLVVIALIWAAIAAI